MFSTLVMEVEDEVLSYLPSWASMCVSVDETRQAYSQPIKKIGSLCLLVMDTCEQPSRGIASSGRAVPARVSALVANRPVADGGAKLPPVGMKSRQPRPSAGRQGGTATTAGTH